MAQLSYEVVFLVQSLCGAVILVLLDLWLRRKNVKDPVLVWLYVSLLSWSARGAIELVRSKWPTAALQIPEDQIKYVFSPVSSILFTMTAFRLARVRDLLRRHHLQSWPKFVVISVAIVSGVAWLLLLAQQAEASKWVDAFASTVALIALGFGLAYSFHIYGNQFLVALTGITFVAFIGRQFYQAAHAGLPDVLAPFFLANSTMLIMLFIALAVAWGLSVISGLKPVGVGVEVDVVAMFFDLRGSTHWAEYEVGRDFRYVSTFIDQLLEWSWKNVSATPQGRPNLVKFLGDGFMFVWELSDHALAQSANAVVSLAYKQYDLYPAWAKEDKEEKLPWGAPDAIGVGVDVGTAIRLTFENGSYDYLGSPVNIAAKMQNLARPNGGVVIQKRVWALLSGTQDSFPKEGSLKLGKESIPIRATNEVELQV
jgi:class 3 adenylate cyclase